ncbi:MAG: tetratricopeptide repeat protein [Planctomycetia bacterium]|nr:tetratricopeptide repeat protein [Planctomycetia bacterium]
MSKSAKAIAPSGRATSRRRRRTTDQETWERLRPWLAGGLLVALALAAYLPALSAGYAWDDDLHITGNATLRSSDGLRQIWFVPRSLPQYYPLVHTTFWIEYHLWELKPAGYHLTNILLHATSAILLWRLLVRLRVAGAWLAAALFAVHPVCVESVAWITERKNVLSLVLALLSMSCYLRFAPAEVDEGAARARLSPERRWEYYGLAFALFALALLSKTVVASLPAVLLVVYWWKRGRIGWRDVVPLVPFFAVGAGLGLFTVWLEQHHVGAQGAEWDLSPVDRLLVAGRALWFYAGKLAWPWPLVFFYPRFSIDAHAWWQYAYPAGVLAVMVGLWLARKRIGRGPLAAVLIFAGVLMPALGFFNVYPFRYSFVADHFQYHASVALMVLAAAIAGTVAARLRPDGRRIAHLVAGTLIVVLAALTYRQTHIYRDLETLYNDTVAKNPDSWAAHHNYAWHVAGQGNYPLAVEHYEAALALNPDLPDTHNALAISLVFVGRPADALAHLERARALNPNLQEIYNNLGNTLVELGRFDEAVAHYRTAIERDPRYATAYCGLGRALARLGRFDDALTQIEQALRIDPRLALAHDTMGMLLYDRGRPAEALPYFIEAARINPNSLQANFHLGCAYEGIGRHEQAVAYLQRAALLGPGDVAVRLALATVLVAQGQLDRAAAELETALRIDPQNAACAEKLKSVRAAQQAARPR